MAKVDIGPISEDTLRTEDLLDCFADTLEVHLSETHLETRADAERLIVEARQIVASHCAETERAGHVLEELTDWLCDIAPPYVYFGTLEGDGACFGFWADVEGAVEARDYGELADEGLELEVNDHGNATLYQIAGEDRTEIWAVV